MPDRLFKLIFIEVWLLYNVGLLLPYRKRNQLYVHTYPLSVHLFCLLHLGRHRALSSFLSVQQVLLNYLFHT